LQPLGWLSQLVRTDARAPELAPGQTLYTHPDHVGVLISQLCRCNVFLDELVAQPELNPPEFGPFVLDQVAI